MYLKEVKSVAVGVGCSLADQVGLPVFKRVADAYPVFISLDLDAS